MAGGTIGAAASLFSGGKNCLNAWKDASGQTPIYGNTQNMVQVNIIYDMYLKYTFYYDRLLRRDVLGCSSQRANVTTIETDTFLYSSTGGRRIQAKVYPNETYRTPNYNNPEPKAYGFYLSGWVETVEGEIYNRKIIFGFPKFTWPLVGDVNNDGKVDAKDKAILNRYLAGWEGYDALLLNREAADINKDLNVNANFATVTVVEPYTNIAAGVMVFYGCTLEGGDVRVPENSDLVTYTFDVNGEFNVRLAVREDDIK